MKRFICFTITLAAFVLLLTACSGRSQADIDESIALESAQERLAKAESESESIAESVAEKEKEIAEEKAKKEQPNYIPTAEEKELICGDWYRSKDDGEGDTDLYWLSMDEKGYCKFLHETMNSSEIIDDLQGTWDVDDHGFVNIDLEKYSGKFRFLKNSYGSTNIICVDGDDFVESGEEGAYAAFVPVKWYKGNLRFVEGDAASDNAENPADAADTADAAGTADTAGTTGTADAANTADTVDTADATDPADPATPSEPEHKMIYIEMQGEGDKWFRLAGIEGFCKVDVDTEDEEILCRIAVNQNDHLVVKIQQLRK